MLNKVKDESYMRLALELASKGKGRVNPNPMVGAVIVLHGQVIGKGYHKNYGEAHAERNAINDARDKGYELIGSTIYVTLEPCSHYGKTPPCVEAIKQSGIDRVVIGMQDPNPLVSGNGIKYLNDNGIETTVGILEEECISLNAVFIKYITTQMPYVLYKTAMSLDGKVATYSKQSKWISCEKSRVEVQELRNEYKGIMVGINTVIYDNPSLTCRIEGGRSPIPIIIDSNLRIPEDSLVLDTDADQIIVITTKDVDCKKVNRLNNRGIQIVQVDRDTNGRVNLVEALKKVKQLNIDSILLEGGGTLAYEALKIGVIDKVRFYIAPKLIGGKDALTPLEGKGINDIDNVIKLCNKKVRQCGDDIVIEANVRRA